MKVKVYTAKSEIEASMVKDILLYHNVLAESAPGENSLNILNNGASRGPNFPHDIFVDESDVVKATEIIKDNESELEQQ